MAQGLGPPKNSLFKSAKCPPKCGKQLLCRYSSLTLLHLSEPLVGLWAWSGVGYHGGIDKLAAQNRERIGQVATCLPRFPTKTSTSDIRLRIFERINLKTEDTRAYTMH